MIKFIKTKNEKNEFDKVELVTMQIDDNDMTHMELTEIFNNFLQAIGYVLPESEEE